MENQQKGNSFSIGFVIGLLFGVCLTLLLVTKKGRKLLRTLSEEGFENMKDFKARLKQADIAIDEDLYYDDLEEEVPVAASPKQSMKENEAHEVRKAETTNGVTKKPAKKLFRGIPRKSS